LAACVKSYELREGSAVIEVKVAKTGRTWKFGFCCDMSLALGVLGLFHKVSGYKVKIQQCLRSFSTPELKSTPNTTFQKFTGVTLGQKWMPKIKNGNDYMSFLIGQVEIRSRRTSSFSMQ
jgi:hypothetical protein